MNKKLLLIGLVLFLLTISSGFAVGTAPSSASADGYYSLDDIDLSGSNPLDLTPNGNDGTSFAGITTGVAGILNEGFDFDGTSTAYLTLTDAYNYAKTDSFSLSFWINSNEASFQPIITTVTNSVVNGWGIDFSSGKLQFSILTSGSDYIRTTTDSNFNDLNWHHVVITYDGSSTSAGMQIYVDGSLVSQTRTNGGTLGTLPTSTTLFVGKRDGRSEYLGGDLDEIGLFNVELDSSEVTYLYQSGTPTSDQQYPFTTPITPSDERIQQVIEVEQLTPVEINSATYVDIYSTQFSVINNSDAYTSWIIEAEAINKDMTADCRVLINGTDYETQKTRSLLNGETGIMYLFSQNFSLIANETYTATLQCNRGLNNGARLNINKAEGMINIMQTVSGTPLNNLFLETNLTLNSTSYVKLAETNFTTSNLTGDNLIISLISDGSIDFEYDSDATISIYATLNGETSPVFERYGLSGTNGSGAGLYLVSNISAAENVTFALYGKSTSGSGEARIKASLVEMFSHAGEATVENLAGKTIPTTTWATIETIYINNSNHATADLLTKTAFSVVSTSGDQEVYYRFKSGSDFSPEYTQSINADGVGMVMLQHFFEDKGLTNTSIELQAYTSSANADITAGGVFGYVSEGLANTPQFYEVTARDDWDNSTINTFNVTTAGGTLYQTTTGSINIYHVNGFETFTTSAPEYFQRVTINHDTTTNTTSDLYQTDIKFIGNEIITGNLLSGNITIDGRKKETSESFFLKAGTYEVTFEKDGYFTKLNNFTVTALQNQTLNFTNLGDSQLKINATSVVTGGTETDFNISFQFNGTELDTYQTTNGTITIGVLQGYNYTILVNDSLHALQYFYVNPDEQYYNVTLGLSVINSILLNFFDEVTGERINNTNMTALLVGANSYEYSTTNGTIFADLITPSEYEIRYYSTLIDDYKLRSYYFTLTDLSFNNINLYSLNESAEADFTTATISFTVLNNNFAPVETARVIVQRYYADTNGYTSIFSRDTNSEGNAVGVFETVDAFYKYSVYYNNILEYSSSNTGVQFTTDDNIVVYIDTSEEYGESIDNILDLKEVTDLNYIETGNFTGVFELDFTNNNNIQICLEVSSQTEIESFTCSSSISGTLQTPIVAPSTRTSIYTAKAMAYDTNTEQYITFDSEVKEFILSDIAGASEAISLTAIFVVSMLMVGIALLLINYPIAAFIGQLTLYLIMVLSPLSFIVGTVSSTISFAVSFILVAIFIVARGKNE